MLNNNVPHNEITTDSAVFTHHNERITGVTTTLPLLIGECKAKLKATVVVAQQFLPRVGMRTPPQAISLLMVAPCASFDSGKNCCVVTPDVRRKQRHILDMRLAAPSIGSVRSFEGEKR